MDQQEIREIATLIGETCLRNDHETVKLAALESSEGSKQAQPAQCEAREVDKPWSRLAGFWRRVILVQARCARSARSSGLFTSKLCMHKNSALSSNRNDDQSIAPYTFLPNSVSISRLAMLVASSAASRAFIDFIQYAISEPITFFTAAPGAEPDTIRVR